VVAIERVVDSREDARWKSEGREWGCSGLEGPGEEE